MNVNLIELKVGGFSVSIGDIDCGIFEQIDNGGPYSYYPKLQHRLTGDHYIAIGHKLNELNKGKRNV